MHNVGIILVMHYHPIAKNMRFHERDERKLEGRRVERRGDKSREGKGGAERSEEERKRIYPLVTDGQDELNPTEELNRTLDGSSGQGKTHPKLSFRA